MVRALFLLRGRGLGYLTRKGNQTGHKGKKGKIPLSGGDPYEITLVRLNQVSLDRRRREKVIWEMITEHSCNPFANLEC